MPIFMNVPGITGEATGDYNGWIEIQSFSWGVTNPGAIISSGGGGGAGKAVAKAFSFTKGVDKSSPELFLATASGKQYATVEIDFVRSPDSGGSVALVQFLFSGVVFSSWEERFDPSAAISDRPFDVGTLNFSKARITYLPNSDGKVTEGWDFKFNKKLS